MVRLVTYMPTYSPDAEAEPDVTQRTAGRLSNAQITDRLTRLQWKTRARPWCYMDAIDTVVNTRPDAGLQVVDAASAASVKSLLIEHSSERDSGHYRFISRPDKESQWKLLNDVLVSDDFSSDFFIYTSSDVLWLDDWVSKALEEFDRDPNLLLLFPTVSDGDRAAPWQIAPGPVDQNPFEPPFQAAARAPVCNAYAFMARMDLFKAYGGYPTLFRNCFTESFLSYLCEALGGTMKVAPRCWAFHHNGVDKWTGPSGTYAYESEKAKFDGVMDRVQDARIRGKMTKEFLKEVLWKKT